MAEKFTVNQSIWIVAAMYAYEQYNNGKSSSELDYCLTASDIQAKAQMISRSDVQLARIHQHVNGDHENCSNRFIRRLEISEGKPVFRATATGEFDGDREIPDDIDFELEVDLDGKTYSLNKIREFVEVDYPVIINSFDDSLPLSIYSIEEIRAALHNNGIEGKDIASDMVQIGPKRSTIHVTKTNGIIFYATEDEFKKIIDAKSLQKNVTTYHPLSKEIMQNVIDKENRRADAVLCFEGGNTVMHPSTAAKYNPHEVRLYSKACFDAAFKAITGFTMKSKKSAGTKWMIAGNPKQYDVIGAFEKLGKLNWRQTFNAKVGDIVYIYVSDNIKEFRYKCRVNKADLESIEIDDSEFNLSGEFDGSYGRYMELEPIRVLGGVAYSREELLKHGFKTLMGPMRVPEELQEYLDSLEQECEVKEQMAVKQEFDKNMILYGPPGTGKTYNSAIIAVKICDPTFDTSDYAAVMQKYNELKAQNRIAFTTFHQSYGYEEFIEGIKPVVDNDNSDIGYKIEPGCFKKFCEIARTPASIDVDPNASIWFIRLDSDNAKVRKDICFAQGIVNEECSEDWSKNRFVDMMQIGDYIISYAGNSVFIDAIGVVEGEAFCDESKESYKWTRKVKWNILKEKVDVKAINGNTYLPNFSIAKMNHMKLSDLLRLIPENQVADLEKPYVFVIDEINRGNISKIFGELITLIENTKREGMDEAASAILPYSGEAFSVPSNVYILGTMNTADRSIALMDTALRRRFSFIEMMPDADVLRNIGADVVEQNGVVLDVANMLETINSRIEFLYDREHTIGHAFFTGLASNPSIDKLASIFSKSVIPLLQEYFYEDYQKIQLVLGDNAKKSDDYKFILNSKVNLKNLFLGNVEDIVDEKEVTYSINEDALLDINSYIGISEII